MTSGSPDWYREWKGWQEEEEAKKAERLHGPSKLLPISLSERLYQQKGRQLAEGNLLLNSVR